MAEGRSLSQSLPEGLERVEARDRALLQQLCYGTLRSFHRLQGVLQQLLSKPLKSKDADLHALLLCGAYQLLEMRTPDHAAISSTVDACRQLKKKWATGLVNGVLRRCAREQAQLLESLTPAQAHSHPPWLFKAISEHWPEHSEQVFLANNQPPPMTLRVNRQHSTADAYIAELASFELEASPGKLADTAVYLNAAQNVEQLPGFSEGRVSVQDEAAQLAADILAPAAGARVLDACSAPGGKCCHLLELQPDLAELVAMDSDAERLLRVDENLKRLGLEARLVQGDASAPGDILGSSGFDHILLDAPCSGSGVIRRHPDIKLLRRATNIRSLADTQVKMLKALWPMLKPGGSLLYVTCSILPEENSLVVRRFLEKADDADYVMPDILWGIDCSPGRQLLPAVDGADGLYFARLVKRAS
jgi:16S rRNA (cytosine967-C5)-methyltransferase